MHNVCSSLVFVREEFQNCQGFFFVESTILEQDIFFPSSKSLKCNALRAFWENSSSKLQHDAKACLLSTLFITFYFYFLAQCHNLLVLTIKEDKLFMFGNYFIWMLPCHIIILDVKQHPTLCLTYRKTICSSQTVYRNHLSLD